ncbi:EexN family lipoprotein [Bartonella schoenbuchensis]|uniref:EexN family lipoprotein n=1 Tax=Bartonella schoenbuchensis TaxID=165694 RepID=UPI001ABA10A8|nr:EexN family lipoprotein [Bartonella schoenbuchensis]
MNKIIITTLLLCTGLIIAGCEKTYSVEEFKKSEELLKEWAVKCGSSGKSKNCENARIAYRQLRSERYSNSAK